MKQILMFGLLIGSILSANAQTAKYFQQDVHYDIQVSLNDVDHTLKGRVNMSYKNNSPNELSQLYFHLWWNAYKGNKSGFAQQQVRNKSLDFYFSDEKDRGYYENISFKVNGEVVAATPYKDNEDIVVLNLKKPIAQKATAQLEIPFEVKLPKTFSRGGHVKQSYQMTQWFPKPAVYDRDGWHPLPYLDQGEFYSEYGSFDVRITLPKYYKVAATGTLETQEEREWLDGLAKAKNTPQEEFPETGDDRSSKTIRYTAENVHDFAWFADPRFAVRKAEATLPSGKKIDTWAFFPAGKNDELWEQAAFYTKRAVEFYSEKVGEYPYPHATAVYGPLFAGGGMEYPMVTIISDVGGAESLDEVVMHEVGHNWFYGILGSNERDHAWMDEGLNSYIESRYMEQYYPDSKPMLPKQITEKGYKEKQDYLVYRVKAAVEEDQACETSSNDFTNINYYLGAYGKPTLIFRYLQEYLGTEEMDKLMHAYFDKWKFKHPQPTDIREVFENGSGKNLSFIFDDLIKTNKKIDYKLGGRTASSITVINKGEIVAPFMVHCIKDGKIVTKKWFEGVKDRAELPLENAGSFDKIIINGSGVMPEPNQRNNMLPHRMPALKFGIGVPSAKRAMFSYLVPIVAWNNYDKTMLGAAFYSDPLLSNWEIGLAPMFATGSKTLAGVANVGYNWYKREGAVRRIYAGVGAKSFSSNYIWNGDYHLRYWRVAPKVELELAPQKATSGITQTITARSLIINEEKGGYNNMGEYTGNRNATRVVNDLAYQYKNTNTLNPHSAKLTLTQSTDNGNDAFIKAELEGRYKYVYAKKGKGLEMRLYAGTFLYNADKKFGRYALTLFGNGRSDYNYDSYYFGRSDQMGVFSNQVTNTDGGMKLNLDAADIGRSNNMVVALNLKAGLPFKLPLNLPLKPYFDIGYHKITAPSLVATAKGNELLYNGGICLDFMDETFAIYLPLIVSNNMKLNYLGLGKYPNRIHFSFNVNKLYPKKLVRSALPF